MLGDFVGWCCLFIDLVTLIDVISELVFMENVSVFIDALF